MPAVREATAEEPVKLEVVEVSPGVFLKLNPAAKQAYLERRRQAEPVTPDAAPPRAKPKSRVRS